MSNSVMKIKGLDGTIELMNDRVVITREGMISAMKYGINSRREIPLGMISEVSFKAPSFFSMGSIEFIRSGNNNNNKQATNMNIVKFDNKTANGFENLKEKIFELINKQRS